MISDNYSIGVCYHYAIIGCEDIFFYEFFWKIIDYCY